MIADILSPIPYASIPERQGVWGLMYSQPTPLISLVLPRQMLLPSAVASSGFRGAISEVLTAHLKISYHSILFQLLESESIAENCRSRLIEQGIPFYRFNPHLDDVIPAGETDTEKLLNMILKARTETIGQQMDELVQMFHLIAEMTRKLKARKKCEAKMARFSA